MSWIEPGHDALFGGGDLTARRARNARQPVSRLPFEVTTAIFRLFAYSDPPGWKFSGYKSDGVISLGWIATATHVCSQWRAYALADTFLWALCASEIPNAEAFEVFSRRAQDIPLYLNNMRRKLLPTPPRAHPDEPVHEAMVPMHFSPQYSQAQSVTLALANADIVDWVDLVSSAGIPPQLHTLHLYFTGAGRDSNLTELRARDYGPYSDSHSHSPSILRHVLFTNCFVPFPSQNLITLRLLEKEYEDWAPRTPVLLDILANASKLESLWLCNWVDDEDEVPLSPTLEMPSLLELTLTASSWKNRRFNSALLMHLVCPRLKTLTCEGVLERYLPPSEMNHGLDRVVSSLHVQGDRAPESLYTYSLKILDRQHFGDESDCSGVITFGHLSLDDTIGRTAGETNARHGLSLKEKHPHLNISIQSLQHPEREHNPTALRACSTFAFYDEGLWSMGEAHVFQSIIAAHAFEYEEVLSAAEVLHLGTYFTTRGMDWSFILANFTSARTLIIDYEQPNPSHEDGLIVAVTRRALEGRLLLPSLTTILTDRKVPWRVRDVSAIRAFVEARAACGGAPISIRPLDKNEWKPAVLNYFDGLV